MSERLGIDDGLDSTEHRYLLDERSRYNTRSTAQRDNMGVQSGVIHGDVTMHYGPTEVPLVAHRKTSEEFERVRQHFVPPGGYPSAERILREKNIVVLSGRGSGRSYAALRLLEDCYPFGVNEVNRERALRSLREEDLEPRQGYVLTVSDLPEQPFTGWEFKQCAGALRAVGSKLVIVVDDPMQVASEAVPDLVSLRSPDPVEVARTEIYRRCPGEAAEALLRFKENLMSGLDLGDPPEKAVRAADLAIRMHRDELDAERALLLLREQVEDAVARWFEGWSIREYAMALAVAVLENHPYDEVVTESLALDEAFRTAQLREDRPLQPRKVFDKSKQQLLRDIRCQAVIRDHPRHTGLQEETVRFERQGWANAVLRYVWTQFASAHEVLHKWLIEIGGEPARHALCHIIAEVPAHRPLRLVTDLAANRSPGKRRLAASAVEALADKHDLLPLVKETLRSWAAGGAFEKATAAAVYTSPFGLRDLDEALAQLARIGRSSEKTPQDVVIGGMLRLILDWPEHHEILIDTVVTWSDLRHRKTGLRLVSLNLALWLAGFTRKADRRIVEQTARFEEQIRILVQRALADSDFGVTALRHLSGLILEARVNPGVRKELIRLARLIVPDLSRQQCRRKVADLAVLYPTRRHDIRRIFRTARKAERQQAGTDLVSRFRARMGWRPRSAPW
ncbi:hypothetical protein [Saccharopolyspora gregorii]|uniref:Uncharacterized protein n=1 Tax=Saccharopolyspora gregorii TaxID=33914 RepID=A0ABP6RRN2_9PSEU